MFWGKVWKGKLSFSWCFRTNLDMISKLGSKFEQILFFDEVSISLMLISEKYHTARLKRIDTLNMTSLGNQLLIK